MSAASQAVAPPRHKHEHRRGQLTELELAEPAVSEGARVGGERCRQPRQGHTVITTELPYEPRVFGGCGGVAGGRGRDSEDEFESAVDAAMGDRLRASPSLGARLWGSLANVTWRRADGATAGYSFRAAGDLISAIVGVGDYMGWYCSAPDGVVDDEIADLLAGGGWYPADLAVCAMLAFGCPCGFGSVDMVPPKRIISSGVTITRADWLLEMANTWAGEHANHLAGGKLQREGPAT